MSKRFVWVSPSSGLWQAHANWDDLTDGFDPSSIVPGSLDDVTFNSYGSSYQFISGVGSAGSLTLNGGNAVIGTIALKDC